MSSYKQKKISTIVKEILIVSGQSKYDIAGIDLGKSKFFYRVSQEQFQDLNVGDYTLDKSNNTQTIEITNSEILQKAEAIQICYVVDLTSSRYEFDFDIDINRLTTSYNQLVDDVHVLWEYVKKTGMIADDTTIDLILPQLNTDEVWVKTEDGYKGVSLTDAEGEIKKVIEKYTIEMIDKINKESQDIFDKEVETGKQEISDHVSTEMDKITDIIENIEEQQYKYKLPIGENTVELPEFFVPSTKLKVFVNGLYLSAPEDYTIENRTITLKETYEDVADVFVNCSISGNINNVSVVGVEVSVDDNVGVPYANGVVSKDILKLNFKNLKGKTGAKGEKGDKPTKGVDYLTPQEQEQFTTDTLAIVRAEGEKVIEDVKNIIGENPASGNALTLGGKTRPEFEADIKATNDNQKKSDNNIKFLKDNIIHQTPTTQKGFLNAEGNYVTTYGYHSKTVSYICEEGYVFSYKGMGENLAVSYIMKKGDNIITTGKINNPYKPPQEITIPYGVDNIIFSSFADESTDVVLEVVQKKPILVIDKIDKLEESTTKIEKDTKEYIKTTNSNIAYIKQNIFNREFLIVNGYLKADGTYGNPESYHSKNISYICEEGYVFSYKGMGANLAVSYIMKKGDNIITTGKINNTNDLVGQKVIIPSGVDNIIFSSFANKNTDIILEVKLEEPLPLINNTIYLDEKVSNILDNVYGDILSITTQDGILDSKGRYLYKGQYHSKTREYKCKENDVFSYKGIGRDQAVSYIMKQGDNIITTGQINNPNDFTEVIVLSNVDTIVFSSYADKGKDVILEVIKKNPSGIIEDVEMLKRDKEKIENIDKLLTDVYSRKIEFTEQEGYLSKDGRYITTYGYFSKSAYSKCKENDVFSYKGIGRDQAVSYIMKQGGNIVTTGQINNRSSFSQEIIIPSGVDNIIFSSFDVKKEDVILEVKFINSKDFQSRIERIEESNGNVLKGKKWVACGDSFTQGYFEGFVDEDGLSGVNSPVIYDKEWNMYKTYPWWIARRNGMQLINEAITGSIIALSRPYIDGTQDINYLRPFSYERYKKIPVDTDYITLWFGINDSDSDRTYLGDINDKDNRSFYGAWNVVLEWLITNRPYAKIGIVITNLAKESYRTATREVAEKWGIPYLDMMGDKQVPVIFGRENNLGLDNKAYQLRLNSFGVSSTNLHPNIKAHEYQSTFIENFLRRL